MTFLLANLSNIARFLVGLYFAFYGFWNIYHWTPIIRAMNKDNLPHPYLILPIGIIWQFLCGFLIMINAYAVLAAICLLPFVLISIFIFHPFWRYQGELRTLNFSAFMSNLLLASAALLFVIG